MNSEYQEIVDEVPTTPQPEAPSVNNSPYVNLQRYGIYIHPASVIKCQDVSIGKGTRINGPIKIKGVGSCVIGKYCAFGDDIHIITSNHFTNYANIQDGLQRKLGFKNVLGPKGVVDIGSNVWMGDNVIVLPGVRVGHGAVVGAGSVVTKDITDFTIVAGVPAVQIKKRFSDSIIDQMLEISWWEWTEEKMARNQVFFETDFSHCTQIDLRSILSD